jgi:ssDNA-binding Zn-finger/Zn-ribbon topoisomerase 1
LTFSEEEDKMTVLNFWPSWITWIPEEKRKDELFRLIRSGEKTRTTRPKEKKGGYYQLYYGKRGSKKELIAEVVPNAGFMVFIDSEKKEIRIDGCRLTDYGLNLYIDTDGFKGHHEAFWSYFKTGTYYSHSWQKPIERERLGWRIQELKKPKEEISPCPGCNSMTKSIRKMPFVHVCEKCGKEKLLSDIYFNEAKNGRV